MGRIYTLGSSVESPLRELGKDIEERECNAKSLSGEEKILERRVLQREMQIAEVMESSG